MRKCSFERVSEGQILCKAWHSASAAENSSAEASSGRLGSRPNAVRKRGSLSRMCCSLIVLDSASHSHITHAGGSASGLAVMDPKKGGNKGGGGGSDVDKIFAAAESGGAKSDKRAALVIRFYKNGFTVERDGVEGDLRDPESPEGKKFMSEIQMGRLPSELNFPRDAEVEVTPEDRRTEDYKPPAYRAFSGTGSTIGGSTSVASAAVVKSSGSASARSLAVDESKPTTIIQVKLANGKREKVTLNTSHTVADLQAKVAAFGATAKPFYLTAGFPPKPLAAPTATIEEAGLLNSSVNQVEQK
jgi:UBX domain-containing protein 1